MPKPVSGSDYKEQFYRSYYNSHIVSRKGEASLEQFALRSRIYDAVWSRLMPPDRGATILDVGCGTGSLVWWLQQRGYASAEGIDVSSEQIEVASRLGVRNVAVADLNEYLGERPGCYEALILRDVLEHFERPRIIRVLGLCLEALRPGGRLIVQVPNAEAPFWGRIRYGDFTHELAFTEGSLRQLFAVVGFASPAVYPAGPVRLRGKDFPRQILWRCLEAAYKLMVFAETGRRWAVVTESIIAVARRAAPAGGEVA
ncbi:MAG: class I SAM-dependent methyltransferase [Gemmatimonadales bacterium]|nr:class I SAM-dependent methyltransferase [Gemmatimonadales bacterium]